MRPHSPGWKHQENRNRKKGFALLTDLHGYYLEDMEVGMTDSYAKTITEADIVLFQAVSGDTNPVHLNEEFARQTMFKGRIAHGMLSASLISTVFGTRLPGPGAIYVSQSLRFVAPVKAGDTVSAHVTVTKVDQEKGRVHFDTHCAVGGKVVLDGQAELLVFKREAVQAAAE
jgi:3-hydroxybutyryl-CoA dehydratase